jgi:hypothetical protein
MSGAWTFRDVDDSRDMKFGVPETNESVADDSWDNGPNTSWDLGDNNAWSKFTTSTLIEQDIMATVTNLRALDQSTSFNGADYLSRLERTGLDFGALDKRKQVRAMYPKAQGGKIRVAIGAAHYISGPYKWSQYKDFDPVNDHKVSIRINGRFIGVRFEGAEPWRISGYDMDVLERGTH